MLSVIGSGEKPSCEITTPGGSCIIDMTLPENRGLSIYSVDLDFQSVPEANFKGYTEVKHFATGSWTEEDDEEEPSDLEDTEKTYMYLYRIPTDWGVPYEIQMTSEVSMASASVTKDTSATDIDLDNGVISISYPYPTIEVCTKDDDDDCRNDDYYLVHTYDDENRQGYDERQVDLRRDAGSVKVSVPGTNDDVYSSRVNDPESGPLLYKGIYNTKHLRETVSEKYHLPLQDFNKEMALWATVIVELDNKGDAVGTCTAPPTMFIEYKEAVYPSNVKYNFGGEELVYYETFSGPQNEIVTTLDFSAQVNEYCGRNKEHAGTCNFPLTFTSDTIGIIVLDNEDQTMSIVSGDTEKAGISTGDGDFKFSDLLPDFGNVGNSITGAVTFDFENHQTGSWVFIGILFVGLLSVVIFLPGGKKK